MNFIFLAVCLLGIWGIRPRRDDAHLSKEQTGAINGFFVLLVFLRHTVDYINLGPWDGLFKTVNTQLDQLIVVPFLFYSGYGIMRSIRAKGHSYVAGIPWNRFFKVWYHFAAAVALYLVLGLFMGKNYGFVRIALSFTGWDSIGNSNWYIFATLCMYLFTWLSFTLFRKNHTLAVTSLVVLSVGYILVLRQWKGIWWYDTALVYPAGALYGLYKEPIEGFLRKKRFLPLLATAFCGAVFVLCFVLQDSLIAREGMAVFFALTVLGGTMLFRLGNPVLTFLGKYTFEIYILQRIPMIILQKYFSNQYIYLAAAFCATLLLAVLFHKLLSCTDGWIYRKGGNTK
jgi:hypothetical protein